MGLIFSDIPELEGTNTEIVLANLSSLENELGGIFERRIAHLCDLALSVIKDGKDIDLIRSIILSIRPDDEINADLVLQNNVSYLRSFFSEISIVERIIIFKQIFEKIPYEDLLSPYDTSVRLPFDAVGRIAYIQNSYNDLVFKRFSDILKDAKASYYDSVSDMCQTVLNGDCQFCFLPIETAKYGKLILYYDQMLSCDLKITAECDIYNADGTDYTRYALLSKGTPMSNQLMTKRKGFYFQIAFSDMENMSLKEILISAELFDLKPESVDTLILKGEKRKKLFYIEFSSSDISYAQAFLSYLSVDCPDHIFIGLYQRF